MTRRRPHPRILRCLHGPENVVGIGRYLADEQRRHGQVADFIVYEDNTTRQNHHVNLRLDSSVGRWGRLWGKLRWTLKALRRYDVFVFYFGHSLLPGNLDMPLLKLFGKKIVMIYCGSDIRLVEVDRRRNPYAHLLRYRINDPKYDAAKKQMMRKHNRWVDRFVVARNLIAYARTSLPDHKLETRYWFHNTLPMDAYRPSGYSTKTPPVLVHAPSQKGVKGTEYVNRAIEELRREGYTFEYRHLHRVANDEAQRIYREQADVIIDQFIIGGFANLAMEGMYYGKPVVGYVLDEIREMIPDCPVINATIDNLKEKLAWLIENPAERESAGRAGRAFVEKHCDRRALGKQFVHLVRDLYK